MEHKFKKLHEIVAVTDTFFTTDFQRNGVFLNCANCAVQTWLGRELRYFVSPNSASNMRWDFKCIRLLVAIFLGVDRPEVHRLVYIGRLFPFSLIVKISKCADNSLKSWRWFELQGHTWKTIWVGRAVANLEQI